MAEKTLTIGFRGTETYRDELAVEARARNVQGRSGRGFAKKTQSLLEEATELYLAVEPGSPESRAEVFEALESEDAREVARSFLRWLPRAAAERGADWEQLSAMLKAYAPDAAGRTVEGGEEEEELALVAKMRRVYRKADRAQRGQVIDFATVLLQRLIDEKPLWEEEDAYGETSHLRKASGKGKAG